MGYTEAGKLLREEKRLRAELEAVQKKEAGGGLEANDAVRAKEFELQLWQTQEKIQTRILELSRQQKQIQMDATREFQKGLLLAGPGETAPALSRRPIDAAAQRGFRRRVLCDVARNSADVFRGGGGRSGLMNRWEQRQLRGRNQTVEQQQAAQADHERRVEYWNSVLRQKTDKAMGNLPAMPLPTFPAPAAMAEGGVQFNTDSGWPRFNADSGWPHFNSVSSPTYFPRFNAVAGEKGREALAVLASPRVAGGRVTGKMGGREVSVVPGGAVASGAGLSWPTFFPYMAAAAGRRAMPDEADYMEAWREHAQARNRDLRPRYPRWEGGRWIRSEAEEAGTIEGNPIAGWADQNMPLTPPQHKDVSGLLAKIPNVFDYNMRVAGATGHDVPRYAPTPGLPPARLGGIPGFRKVTPIPGRNPDVWASNYGMGPHDSEGYANGEPHWPAGYVDGYPAGMDLHLPPPPPPSAATATSGSHPAAVRPAMRPPVRPVTRTATTPGVHAPVIPHTTATGTLPGPAQHPSGDWSGGLTARAKLVVESLGHLAQAAGGTTRMLVQVTRALAAFDQRLNAQGKQEQAAAVGVSAGFSLGARP